MDTGLDQVYAELDEHAKELYRSLGVHPSHRFIPAAAAAMLAADTETAEQAITALLSVGLIQDPGDGGYTVAALIQDHAHRMAEQTETPARTTRTRVIHQAYLPVAAEADFRTNRHPQRYNHDHYADLISGGREPRFADNAAAMEWFTSEIGTIAALQQQASRDREHHAVWRLAEASWGYALKSRDNELLLDMHLLGCRSARQVGSPAASVLYSRLSWGYRNAGVHDEAIEAASTAYRLAAQAGNEAAESVALSAHGRALAAAGDPKQALRSLWSAAQISERLGDSEGVALRLRHIAECCLALRHLDEAARHLRAAAARMRLANNQEGLARVLMMLSQTLLTQNPEQASHEARAALEVMQGSGSDAYLGDALATTGDAVAALDDLDAASRYYQRAQEHYARARDKAGGKRMATAIARTFRS